MAATEKFSNQNLPLNASAVDGFAITPDNAEELDEVTRAIFVGTGGDIAIVLKSGVDLLFKNVGSGTMLPVRARLVKATGTSAGDMLGLT